MKLSLVTIVVRDYDEAIEYYRKRLGFRLVEDTKLSTVKRWVRIAPSEQSETYLLLAKAKNDEEIARIGDPTGGRVSFFLEVDDFDQKFAQLRTVGVNFEEKPRIEAYGKVAVFKDLYGNRWDLVGP
jgi:catechol 2,3-dioxygenase-like lactoylglutathione lyase family enzyme